MVRRTAVEGTADPGDYCQRHGACQTKLQDSKTSSELQRSSTHLNPKDPAETNQTQTLRR